MINMLANEAMESSGFRESRYYPKKSSGILKIDAAPQVRDEENTKRLSGWSQYSSPKPTKDQTRNVLRIERSDGSPVLSIYI